MVEVEKASMEEDDDDAKAADADAGAIELEAGLDGARNVCGARFSVGRAVEVRSVLIS